MSFQLKSSFKPTGDQPQAIEKLTRGVQNDIKHQVLLGVTGSGKTFTLANVIKNVNRPTLVISHNKTLAGQLYQEFRDFFPANAVSYFVSYYDYYQPEAYIPQSDTYIEKETEINEEIDKLRLQATANLLTRKDVIVVASVSCIYNIGSPKEYGNYVLNLKLNTQQTITNITKQLVSLQYRRSDYDFTRGTFRVRGDTIFIWPAYEDSALKVELNGNLIFKITNIDPISGRPIDKIRNSSISQLDNLYVYPAKHYMVNPNIFDSAFAAIRKDKKLRVAELNKLGKILEAHRLDQRVEYDLEMIKEFGYVNGIENYSRYFDGRAPGQPPFTLLDYFPKDYLLIIDESHMTIPQLHGMYRGDMARKQSLIDFGFRLPSCLDNRPFRFEEFLTRVNQVIYTSATPDEWEISRAIESAKASTPGVVLRRRHTPGVKSQDNGVVEQLIRPTGILDPEIEIRPTKGQVDDLIKEIIKRKKNGQRVLVTTLTKRLAEALVEYLQESPVSRKNNVNFHYLHAEVETLDRQDILDDLRSGKYDVVVGINLLREGLDLPEVSLVAILDADKEGFLRSKTSLIQTMGRAARHIEGKVIMYADQVTRSMREAIDEVNRRRKVQLKWNKEHHITPTSIKKPIREKLIDRVKEEKSKIKQFDNATMKQLKKIDFHQLTPEDKKKYLKTLKVLMREAAKSLEFEKAAYIRDKIKELGK